MLKKQSERLKTLKSTITILRYGFKADVVVTYIPTVKEVGNLQFHVI